jgi:hypothetical protein
VEHDLYGLHGSTTRVLVPKIPPHKFHCPVAVPQVPLVARREIVDHAHPVPQGDEVLHEVRPDETSAAGDEGDRLGT